MGKEKIKKELLDNLFIIREGIMWNVGILNSGLKYGTGKTPQIALEDFTNNFKKKIGLFQ